MAWDPDFGRPADGKLAVGSGWAADRGGKYHGAIDILIPVGTPVRAVADGVVIRATQTDSGDAGIWVALRHDQLGGVVTRSMHFSKNLVKLGDRVRKGQQIGFSGNTGRSSGPHLHFDIKVPEAMLSVIAAAAGKPATGWLPNQSPYGWGVPAEPWIPVDSYRASTAAEDARLGVKLYSEMPHGGFFVKLLLAGFVAWGGYKLLLR